MFKSVLAVALLGCCVFHTLALPEFKAGVDGQQTVDAVDTNGQTFNGKIATNSQVDGNYKGSKGSGPVSVNSGSGAHQATWNGNQQNANIDQSKSGNLKNSNGDTVTWDGKGGAQNVPVHVKGKDGKERDVHVSKQGQNSFVAVDDKTKQPFQVSGPSLDNTDIKGQGKEYQSKYQRQGTDQNTRLKEKVIGNVGPAFDSNVQRSDPSKEGNIQVGFNPLDTGSTNPLTSLSPAATIKQDKIKTQSCPEGQFGDAFGRGGFEIIDKSISAEVPPVSTNGAVKTYAFPSCFIMKAQVKIPPNINIQDVAGQLTAYVSPVGNLECEKAKECADTATLNRPQGPCFYCDLCDKGQSKSGAVFGSQTDVSSNLCTGRPGQLLPLQWKVCPPPNAGKYDVFQKDLLGVFKTDMDATIRIFVKSKTTAPPSCSGVLGFLNAACKGPNFTTWTLAGCRQAIISYSVSRAGGGSLGTLGAFGK